MVVKFVTFPVPARQPSQFHIPTTGKWFYDVSLLTMKAECRRAAVALNVKTVGSYCQRLGARMCLNQARDS